MNMIFKGGRRGTMNNITGLYDRACNALTEYEEGSAGAVELYEALIDIVNSWESITGDDIAKEEFNKIPYYLIGGRVL